MDYATLFLVITAGIAIGGFLYEVLTWQFFKMVEKNEENDDGGDPRGA